MADDKKYYYLKLKENFFDREEITVIEAMTNGYKYSNILLKMYLKSLKREGKLMVTDYIPYNLSSLSAVVKHDEDTVRTAIELFKDFKLIEILDNGQIYINEIQNFVGLSSTEADRKRQYRNKIDQQKELIELPERTDVGQMSGQIDGQMSRQMSLESTEKGTNIGQTSDKNPPEIELEIELEIDLNIIPYQGIMEKYNLICLSLPKIKEITPPRKSAINARWKQLNKSMDNCIAFLKRVEDSDWLSGRNKEGWKASFDWIFKAANFVKIMEGNYDNKEMPKNNTYSFDKAKQESIIKRQAKADCPKCSGSGKIRYLDHLTQDITEITCDCCKMNQ